MKINTSEISASVLLLLLCSGCGSLLVSHNMKSGPYPGTRLDAHFIVHPSGDKINFSGHSGETSDTEETGGSFSPVLLTLALVDLPFSIALDTLLLPWDLWYREE